jgi:O-antigen biosynthesis protein WbqV
MTIAILTVPLALVLRLGPGIFGYPLALMVHQMILFAMVSLGVLLWTDSHKGVWRYTSMADMTRLVKTVFLCVLCFVPALLLSAQWHVFPLTTLFILPLILASFWGGARVFYRLAFQRREGAKQLATPGLKTLLVGTGPRADAFLREMGRHKNPPYQILGLLEVENSKIRRHIHGLEILGALDGLQRVLGRLAQKSQTPDLILLADDHLRGQRLKAFAQQTRHLKIDIAQLPSTTPSPLSPGSWIKPLRIEDLLGRPQHALDREGLFQALKGKKVLITGVGGSIGGELMRQIADFSPAHMVLLDHSEYLLYQAALDLQDKHPYLSKRLALVDVRERERVFQVMAEEKPDYVFHAAALKHVPLVEKHPLEGIFTNVIGTRHVADACLANRVSAMLLVSTDKAINPSSVMGITKRLAESYCQALDVMPGAKSPTRFVTVRFGNVLGSNGSVVPLFRHQIARGGPVTVTDPEMTRYFMTIHEAVGLILQACFTGLRADIQRGRVFILDMGEPVSILELAENMIRLSGLVPYKDIKITFTGLRPGEKLREELFHPSEKLLKTVSSGIFVASPQILEDRQLKKDLDLLEKAVYKQDLTTCLSLLKKLVPEYTQSGGTFDPLAPPYMPLTPPGVVS